MQREDIGYFDPAADFAIAERGLPHWVQSGTVCFITWRAADSLPKSVLERIDSELAIILRQHGLDPTADWQQELGRRNQSLRGQVHWDLFATRDKFLDQGHGLCLLGREACYQIVIESLTHFDTDRYFLTDVVVMPNHVHFMAAFEDAESMLKQCEDWKRFTARKINRVVGRTGDFWQPDQFDHLIRSSEQFERYRRYIAENSKQAGLSEGTYLHFQKPL
ncbi:MAG: transposase [Pirellula sp.]